MAYQIYYVLGLVHISNFIYCHFNSRNTDLLTMFQIRFDVSNVCATYVISFCIEYSSSFAILGIFPELWYDCETFSDSSPPGRINHSLLLSTSLPYIIHAYTCIRYFFGTTSDILGLTSYSNHNCNDHFCEDSVHLYAGTIWQCPVSGLCSLPLTPVIHPPKLHPIDFLFDVKVVWDTPEILLSS